MSRTAFSQNLILETPELLRISLRDNLEAVHHRHGEVILDLNRAGNWVRGFEIVGGFVPFSIAKAVSPFAPLRPMPPRIPEPGTVTYDPEADAAFFYLEYNPILARLTQKEREELQAVSHSLSPIALYGLDELGGLIWVKMPIADVASPDRLLQLLAGGTSFRGLPK